MSRLPICVDCQIEMEPRKNHYVVEVMAGAEPYQKIAADKFGCPNCNIEVVVGFANKPLAECWQPEYQTHVTDLKAWCSLKDQATFDAVWGADKRRERNERVHPLFRATVNSFGQ
jgi:hypothetical protein